MAHAALVALVAAAVVVVAAADDAWIPRRCQTKHDAACFGHFFCQNPSWKCEFDHL